MVERSVDAKVKKFFLELRRISALNEQVRPVIVPNLKTASYLDNSEPFSYQRFHDRRPQGYTVPLEFVSAIPTRHIIILDGSFIPSLAEILAQIPKEYLDPTLGAVTCYDIKPDFSKDGVVRKVSVKGREFHRGVATLYRYSPSA